MAGFAIGKALDRGFPGGLTRSNDNIVLAKPNVSTTVIKFGEAVKLATGGVAKFDSTSDAATAFAGIAVREVKSPHTYAGNNPQYNKGDTVDFITRGSVNVICTKDTVATTTPSKGGKVYIRKATGVFVAKEEKDADQNVVTLELSGVVWAEDGLDADGVAEITILERKA